MQFSSIIQLSLRLIIHCDIVVYIEVHTYRLYIACIYGTILPADIISSLSLLTFKQRLKMHLFRVSYPDPGLTFYRAMLAHSAVMRLHVVRP